ncbi:Glutamate-rich protein 3, partial [Taenia solium]
FSVETNDSSFLEDYNILADRHLAHFFNSPRVKQHLIKTGLITPKGEIVPEKDFRTELIRKSRQEAALNACIRTLTDEAIELERNRRVKVRKVIEDILNSQRIRKIRAERRQKREREVLRTMLFDVDGFVDLEAEVRPYF